MGGPGSATLLFLPTYNERTGIAAIVPQILDLAAGADVLIIDDGSTDGTAPWCQSMAYQQPRVIYRQRGGKFGLGSANVAAMQFALSAGYRYLVTMDADGSHDPHELGRLLARIETAPACDVVIGSRYVPHGRIVNWPWSRRVTSRLVNAYARTVLGIPVADCSSGFRCYRVDVLTTLDWSGISGSGYEFYEQILVMLCQRGARFAEVPITFVDRTAGRSKASTHVKMQAASALLRLGMQRLITPIRLRTPTQGESSCCTGD